MLLHLFLITLLLLFLQRLDKVNDSLLDLLLRSGNEDMLESAPLLSSQSPLDLDPVAVTKLISQAEQDHIGLFREELGLLSGVSQCHLLEGVVVSFDLLSYDIRSPHIEVDEGLSLLDLVDDLLMVLKCMDFLKEHFRVSRNLFRALRALHMLRNVLIGIGRE